MKQATATPFRAQRLALTDEASASEEIVVTKDRRTGARVIAAAPPADPKASVPFHVDNDAVMKPLDVGWDAARRAPR